ncbi:Microsomal signal peptidase 12 kDa subunit [Aphelenchoides bicaudatus]|nr:Microsomal signal peptidase 12 kDa subunit [Aphelenchoides bicaudatus]
MDLIVQMLPPFIRKFSTHMDFVGQKKAERLLQAIILVHGIVGFLLGFFFERISYMVFTILFGTALASLLVLPPWPVFRRNPLNWQPVTSNEEQNAQSEEKKPAEAKKTKENKKQK